MSSPTACLLLSRRPSMLPKEPERNILTCESESRHSQLFDKSRLKLAFTQSLSQANPHLFLSFPTFSRRLSLLPQDRFHSVRAETFPSRIVTPSSPALLPSSCHPGPTGKVDGKLNKGFTKETHLRSWLLRVPNSGETYLHA